MTKKVEENSTELTPSQVYNVLEFANTLYRGLSGIYTPDLVNQQLKNLTLSPLAPTADKIEKALSDPKNSEAELIGYTEFMELNNALFKRIISYFSGMLSFDLTYSCVNAEDKDYKSSAYKKDLSIVHDFLDKFNCKQEFKTVMRQLVRQEAFFSTFRDDGMKYTLQELPQSFQKITGRWDYGLLFDMNFYYFMLPGVDINMFPEEFRKMYSIMLEEGSVHYDPSLPVGVRNSSYVYWKQLDPIRTKAWCFKLIPEVATRVPLFSSLLGEAVLQPVIRKLQTNSYIQQASKIIYTHVPLTNKDVKGAVTTNQISLSPKVLGEFMALIKAGLPDAISVAASPTQDTEAISFNGSNEIYDSYLKSTASSSGANSRLIYSSDRQNTLETQYSTNVDTYLISHVYHQFANFLNYNINSRTKKFKFKFDFEGTEFQAERLNRLEVATNLANMGMVLPHKIAAAIGMLPQDFQRQLDEARSFGFVDKLTPILNSAQISSKDGGRPKKKTDDLSESGLQTRDEGYNEE